MPNAGYQVVTVPDGIADMISEMAAAAGQSRVEVIREAILGRYTIFTAGKTAGLKIASKIVFEEKSK